MRSEGSCTEREEQLLDINILNGAAMSISDHCLIVAKVKIKEGWEK